LAGPFFKLVMMQHLQAESPEADQAEGYHEAAAHQPYSPCAPSLPPLHHLT
jgi:hypothetical protein